MSLPELTVAPMNFMRSARLRTVDLPKLEETGGMSFMSAQIAGDIEFPKLTRIGDGSFVQGSFAKVTFEAMTTREEDKTGWLISARVNELDMPELTTLNVPFANAEIDTVRMPKLTKLGEGGIAGSIKRLYLGSLTDLNCSQFVSPGQIEELRLDKLKTITRCSFGGLEIGTLYVPLLESIGDNVFSGCLFTKGISFPKLKTMGASNFCGMSIPGNAEFDELTDVGSGCFGGFTCEGSFSVPKLQRVRGAFAMASIGDSVSFPELVEINGGFLSGSKVADLYLPAVQGGRLVPSGIADDRQFRRGRIQLDGRPDDPCAVRRGQAAFRLGKRLARQELQGEGRLRRRWRLRALTGFLHLSFRPASDEAGLFMPMEAAFRPGVDGLDRA